MDYTRGIDLLKADKQEEAEASLLKVSAQSPDFPLAQYHLGLISARRAHFAKAERFLRTAVEYKPDFGEAWCNLGNVQMDTRRFAEADESLKHAIEVSPLLADAFYIRGTLMLRMNRLPEAESLLHRAIALQPELAPAYNSLAEVMMLTGRTEQAKSNLQQAIALEPGMAAAYCNLGHLMFRLGEFDEAERNFRHAIELAPGFTAATFNLARLLVRQKRVEEARKLLTDEIAVRPSSALHCELGVVQMLLSHEAEAVASFRHAVALDARNIKALYGEGGMLLMQNRLEEALNPLYRGYELAPARSEGRLILGRTLLKLGRYREGWPHWEYAAARRDMDKSKRFTDALPEWQGELLKGMSLIVQCELTEGRFDDALLLVRFMPALKAMGVARLTLVCPPRLKRLFSCVKAIDRLKSSDEAVDVRQADYWCYLSSVPLQLGVTLENLAGFTDGKPYLDVDAALVRRWGQQLREHGMATGNRKVGVVSKSRQWTNPSIMPIEFADEKSLPQLQALEPLFDVPGLSFVCLDEDASRRAQWQKLSQPCVDVMDKVQDFADTAAILRNLDLVVSVDASVANLAGALNVPFWLLLNVDGEWRWLDKRADSPWYASCQHIFRQRKAGAWSDVVNEAAAALKDWVAG